MRALTFPLRLISHTALAARYWMALDYSWHLSWVKAAR